MPTIICVDMCVFCNYIICMHDVYCLFVSRCVFICIKYANLSEYQYEEKSHELTSIHSVRSHVFNMYNPMPTRHQNCHLSCKDDLCCGCMIHTWHVMLCVIYLSGRHTWLYYITSTICVRGCVEYVFMKMLCYVGMCVCLNLFML